MKCKECGMLYGDMKDDGVIVNPHLGELCINYWGNTQPHFMVEDDIIARDSLSKSKVN